MRKNILYEITNIRYNTAGRRIKIRFYIGIFKILCARYNFEIRFWCKRCPEPLLCRENNEDQYKAFALVCSAKDERLVLVKSFPGNFPYITQ